MASEVSICNLSLALLGDEATVASIDPPEGSQQADHCARFYPIARDTVLESHSWGFATRREALVQLVIADADLPQGWIYGYQRPNDALKILGIVGPYATGQTVFTLPLAPERSTINSDEVSEEYVEEGQLTDNRLIYTNSEGSWIKYIARVEDTSKYSALFVNALARLLASYLAGPIIKGTEGMKVSAQHLEQYYKVDLPKAMHADASARHKRTYDHYVPSSIAARS